MGERRHTASGEPCSCAWGSARRPPKKDSVAGPFRKPGRPRGPHCPPAGPAPCLTEASGRVLPLPRRPRVLPRCAPAAPAAQPRPVRGLAPRAPLSRGRRSRGGSRHFQQVHGLATGPHTRLPTGQRAGSACSDQVTLRLSPEATSFSVPAPGPERQEPPLGPLPGPIRRLPGLGGLEAEMGGQRGLPPLPASSAPGPGTQGPSLVPTGAHPLLAGGDREADSSPARRTQQGTPPAWGHNPRPVPLCGLTRRSPSRTGCDAMSREGWCCSLCWGSRPPGLGGERAKLSRGPSCTAVPDAVSRQRAPSPRRAAASKGRRKACSCWPRASGWAPHGLWPGDGHRGRAHSGVPGTGSRHGMGTWPRRVSQLCR